MKNILTLILVIISALISAQNKSLKLVSVKTTLLEKGVRNRSYDLDKEEKKYLSAKFTLNKEKKSIIISKSNKKKTILFGNLKSVSRIIDDEQSQLYPTDFVDECLENSKGCGISKTFLNFLGNKDINNISYSLGKSSDKDDKTYVIYFIDKNIVALLINEDFILLNFKFNCGN